MKNYFSQCRTTDDAKTLYRQLCKAHHPDLHADDPSATATMQAINAAYDLFCAAHIGDEMRERYKAQGWTEPTQDDFDKANVYAQKVREAIEKIIALDVEIEICGYWVWVTGTANRGTSPENDAALDALKKAGYKWARDKEKWYCPCKPSHTRRQYSMDEIRDMHGSQTVNHEPKAKHERAAIATA